MNIEDAISIARSTERACKDGEEETALQVLADAVMDLRTAAKLCWDRRDMVSGSLEMGECDEFCKDLGIEPWTWKYRTGTETDMARGEGATTQQMAVRVERGVGHNLEKNMQEPKVQFGTADSADFEKLTWTFTMDGNYKVQGGRHAIMTESEYRRLLEMARAEDAKL